MPAPQHLVSEVALESGVIGNGLSSDEQFAYVSARINWYEKAGNPIESTIVNINNLEPHGKWRFKALVLDSQFVVL